ncbi:NAD(P)-binding protein [Mycena sanguinolenta]|uniref:NAD(P)-binding protein n=1 Tax=Mycena sanguinolenta TaxID=230812 RepID=A0A8H6ZB88_9AGAR|nr:NAD(P)-binding protein [Mycena sanguinolenta]
MGVLISGLKQSWPPKSKFSVDDIPDLSGQVIIVTGGGSGIGKETVKALLQHNAKVYVAARSPENAKAAIEDLKFQTGKQAEFLHLDLADLHAVKRAANEFMEKETRLHVLFNNGGVMACPVEQVTSQNYDLQFGTNVLGHFYFTTLLLPTLIATATPGNPARVVNTSSLASELAGANIDYNTLKDGPARKRKSTSFLYAQSKFGNAVFSNELFRRYGDKGVISVALNPGNLHSNLQRHLRGLQAIIVNSMLFPTPLGALTQLWAGTTDVGKTFGGKYLIPWAREGKSPSTDPAAEKALWTCIGKETVKALLQHNAKVYLAARNLDNAKAAIENVGSQTGGQAKFLQLDLADQHSVKRVAKEFQFMKLQVILQPFHLSRELTRQETRLHVLFNNDGVMVTAQNYDSQFGTNVLGHLYLTAFLLPALLATAAPGSPARVINTSSSAFELAHRKINYNTLKDDRARKKTPTMNLNLYFQSKFVRIVKFTAESKLHYIATRAISYSGLDYSADTTLKAPCLWPSNLRSDLQRYLEGIIRGLPGCDLIHSAGGAHTTLGRHNG